MHRDREERLTGSNFGLAILCSSRYRRPDDRELPRVTDRHSINTGVESGREPILPNNDLATVALGATVSRLGVGLKVHHDVRDDHVVRADGPILWLPRRAALAQLGDDPVNGFVGNVYDLWLDLDTRVLTKGDFRPKCNGRGENQRLAWVCLNERKLGSFYG